MTRRMVRILAKWSILLGLAGPALLWQTACTVDPDLILRGVLQFGSETAIFALDNLIVGPR
jgi:hypothetical protein